MGRRSMNVKQRGFFGTSFLLFSFTFMAAFLSASHFAPVVDGSASSDISMVNSIAGYYANIASSGEVEIDLTSTPQGSYEVGSDTLYINTNVDIGYKLYVSTASTSASNGLINEKDSTEVIPASTAAASRLAANTWGFAPARATSVATAAIYDTEDADPTNGAEVWMGVPEYGNETVFYTNTTPTTASTNSLDVYYAVNANTAFSSGIYSNIVVYTAIAETVDETGESEASISPTFQYGLASGLEVAIATGLYPGFSVDNLGTITVTIGGQGCTNIVPTLSEIGSLNIACNAPAQSTYGSKDVVISIPKYGKTYTLTGAYGYKVQPPAFYTITKMQDMTHAICADSRVITPNANATTALTIDNWNTLTDGSGIPTTTLLDDRAGQVSYTVKKLADGKCWMTENLALPSGAVLTASDSDLDGTVVSSFTLPAVQTSSSANRAGMYEPDLSSLDLITTSSGYKVGNYYNWRAATATNGTGSTDSFGQNLNTSDTNALVSICPKGWRLPTSGSGDGTTGVTTPGSTNNLVNGDFSVLVKAYGGTGGYSDSDATVYTRMIDPSYGPNFALAGYINSSAVQKEVDETGGVWSGTIYSSSSPYMLDIRQPANTTLRALGITNASSRLSVRCVAR